MENESTLQKYYNVSSRRVMTSGHLKPIQDEKLNTDNPFMTVLLNVLEHNTAPNLSASALWQDMQEELATHSFASAQFESMQRVNHQGGDFFFLLTEESIDIEIIKKEIRKLISKNKINSAIDLLIEYTDNDKELSTEVILLKNKFNHLQEQLKLGIITYGDAVKERAKINSATLTLINSLVI